MAETRAEPLDSISADRRSDAELVAASCKGDREAFGELIARHQDRAFNLAYRLTGSRDDAAETVQEAFLKAYRGMREFRQQCTFYTWLFRIVVNEARSRRRFEALRRPAFSLDGARGRDAERDGRERTDPPATPRSGEPDPSEQASRAERKEIVEQALRSLDFEQRAIIVLRDIEGRDYAEIAEECGCREGTVKSRLHRARMALKEALTGKLETG